MIKLLFRQPRTESKTFHKDPYRLHTIRTVQPLPFAGREFEHGQSILFRITITSLEDESKSAQVDIDFSYVTAAGTGVIIGATSDALMGKPMTVVAENGTTWAITKCEYKGINGTSKVSGVGSTRPKQHARPSQLLLSSSHTKHVGDREGERGIVRGNQGGSVQPHSQNCANEALSHKLLVVGQKELCFLCSESVNVCSI